MGILTGRKKTSFSHLCISVIPYPMDLIRNDVKAQLMVGDSVGTFVQRVLGEMAVRYVNVYILQQGER